MIAFPNAKINLGLQVIRKREDGYHDIESLLYPIPLHDVLEFRESEELSFHSSGLEIKGKSNENLCLRAYDILKEKYDLPPVEIHLHKVIPMGGGLGGGSSDGAFMLSMLNQQFNLDLDTDSLESYAAQLGSDCPFFIKNQPVVVTGTGIESHAVSIDLKGYQLLLLFPEIHSSTIQAYKGIRPKLPEISIETIIDRGIDHWKDLLHNDFEDSIFPSHPELSILKEQLYSEGAIYASMTGSGSVLYGLFHEQSDIMTDVSSQWLSL